MPRLPPKSAISLYDSMAPFSSGMMSRFRGYPSLDRGMAFGLMLGPSAEVEFIRMDFTPSTAQPSSQRFATSTPAFLSASSGPARLVGALLEMCCTLVPVVTSFPANWSSHFRPEGLIGSKVRPAYIVSSVTSPNRPEKMSIRVTPGNVSLVNCGKSSIVISPYFSFICCCDQPPLEGERGGTWGAAPPGWAAAAAGCAGAGALLPAPAPRPAPPPR